MKHHESTPTTGRREQLRKAMRMRQTLGVVAMGIALTASDLTVGADVIDPQAAAPKPDYIMGSVGPRVPVTAVDPRIGPDVADLIAQSQVVLDVSIDGPDGAFRTQKCAGTYVEGDGIETATHCFASGLKERGSTPMSRQELAAGFNTVTVTPLDRNGALPMMVPRTQTLFENNLPAGNDLAGVTPGEPDSLELQRKDGKLKFPLSPVRATIDPLQMGQALYLYPAAVDTQMYWGQVTGAFKGINGVDAVVARFEPLHGKNPLRAGSSGSGVFTTESGEVKIAAVVSGTFYDKDGTGIDAILSQDDVRRLSAKQYAPQYGPHLARQMPQVVPSGEMGVAVGFTPKNATPGGTRRTLYQSPNLREQAVLLRRKRHG